MNQLLSAREIIKYLGTGEKKHPVLNRVSIEIQSGEYVSVMGPSGSGKSTLLYALSGMDAIDGGEVIFENQNLSVLSENARSDLRRNRMGFVFQQPALLKNLNILDNIILPQMRDHGRDKKKLIEKARMRMRQVGIEDLWQREITQASGGQLQRAGICRALMSEPGILFCDEPTGALNTKAAREIMELFAAINQEGTALLLVTHDPSIAARTERVLFLCDGKIVNETKLGRFSEKEMEKRTGKILREMRAFGI